MRFCLMLLMLLVTGISFGQEPAPPTVAVPDPMFVPPFDPQAPVPGPATITPIAPVPDPMFTPPMIITPDANEILVGPYEPPFICIEPEMTVEMDGEEEIQLDESNSTQQQQCCALAGQLANEQIRYDWVDEELDNLATEKNEILMALQAILATNPPLEDKALAQELADGLIEIIDEQVGEKELELELIAGNIVALQELWLLIGC